MRAASLAIVALAGVVSAQSSRGLTAGPDPYTRAGDPELVRAAGYVSIGPMQWTASHDTAAIEADLGELPYVWIETAHFRICSTLPRVGLGDKDERKKVRAELERLREKLPTVEPRTRALDRWLRAHLFAQRCEELYADFAERLGVDDASFPVEAPAALSPDYMGIGPYLGQADKFVVMLFEREGSLARYTERYFGQRLPCPGRRSFGWDGSLWFGTALEFGDWLREDTTLHCHVAYNVVANLVDGFKNFGQDVPVWWRYGVAAWYGRRIDDAFAPYEQEIDVPADMRDGEADWRPRVRRLAIHGGATPLSDLMQRMECSSFRFHDYLVCWSLVDYLMSRGDEGFAKFMHELKFPAHGRLVGRPGPAQVLAQQERAFAAAFGQPDGVQSAWGDWVRRVYRD